MGGEEGFEPNKTYVIGALVDHNLHKGLCYSLAKDAGISHARLPIDEFVNLKTRKVLAVDHVFHIIGSVVSQKMKWKDAFLNILPDRKGAEAKEEEEISNDSSPKSDNGSIERQSTELQEEQETSNKGSSLKSDSCGIERQSSEQIEVTEVT